MSQTDTLCIHSSNCMIQMHDCFGEKLSNHCRATYRVIHVDLGLPIAYKQGGSLTKEATNRARFSIDSYDICSTSYNRRSKSRHTPLSNSDIVIMHLVNDAYENTTVKSLKSRKKCTHARIMKCSNRPSLEPNIKRRRSATVLLNLTGIVQHSLAIGTPADANLFRQSRTRDVHTFRKFRSELNSFHQGDHSWEPITRTCRAIENVAMCCTRLGVKLIEFGIFKWRLSL